MDNITRELIRKYFGLKLSNQKLIELVKNKKNELLVQALRLRDGPDIKPKDPPQQKKDM